MGRKKVVPEMDLKPIRPMISPEGREAQLSSLAMDLVEERLRNGTASSAEVVQCLKMGSTMAQKQMEKLEEENKMLKAKTKNLEAGVHSEELYQNALKAFTEYRGGLTEEYDYDGY